ncbi:MAG: hypothetical protein CSA49_02265 [Gammaproteobacteria bacterium]|nr:MAG: hypothetical protein CSA49_02265 [Gammaproteobacteria bacterium]
MAYTSDKLAKISSIAIVVSGALMYVSYLLYLPMPAVFESAATESVGLVLYSLATAGAGFTAWGLMLLKTTVAGISRQQVLQATSVGFGLLGFMRLGTAVFPHTPFEQIIYVPVSEFVIFTLLAIKFYKS